MQDNVKDIDESDMEYTSSESDSESVHSDGSASSAGDNLFMDKMQSAGNFKLQMQNCDLSGGIGFVTKFTRVFRQIKQIDFG